MKIVMSSLRKSDVKELVNNFCTVFRELCLKLGVEKPKEGHRALFEDIALYIIDGVPLVFEYKGFKYPTLMAVTLGGLGSTNYVIVDLGAVKHLLNGADVMAPGIIEVSDFQAGDVVSAWSPDRKTALVVGKALMDSKEVLTVKKGRAVKSIHYAGDKVWKTCLEVLRRIK
ncbi:MAG: PUA domain-containing protein [Desulfurococcaceae archaeon]